MFKKMIIVAVILVTSFTTVWAASQYSIKSMTPAVQQALAARKDRFSELRKLKSSGAIGENNEGYVQVLQTTAGAETLVMDENKDRKVIYKTIAQQNGLEDALATIESAFAEVQREKAEDGDKIQQPDGGWVTK